MIGYKKQRGKKRCENHNHTQVHMLFCESEILLVCHKNHVNHRHCKCNNNILYNFLLNINCIGYGNISFPAGTQRQSAGSTNTSSLEDGTCFTLFVNGSSPLYMQKNMITPEKLSLYRIRGLQQTVTLLHSICGTSFITFSYNHHCHTI